MTIVADLFRFVVGVDTHAATHTYTILESSGRVIDQQQFPASPAGLTRAIDWIGRRTEGDLDATLVAAEDTGTYGAILAGRLAVSGYRVVEAPTPRRDPAAGKNDAIDSLAAARSTLTTPTRRLRDRRGGGDQHAASVRSALQVLLTAREQATGERTRAVNALTALLRTNDLDIDARRALTNTQIKTISRWRRREEPIDLATTRAHAVRLALRITELDSQITDNANQIKTLVHDQAPILLDQPGIGPVTAAIILTAWSHPGRVRSETAFAKIAGTAPLPASSGNTQRHRLNRGGDRRLNRALHTIVLTRMRCDPTTRAYTERRRAEGKTTREIRRILKRYTTRQIYRTLNTA
ncbi:IS110 family transposase [Nocardioides panzhihuensis]|uniref:Transposase n=1 Tax=Nocardioides panzhihuensis TaxID=860243 RepID=A0A7Z0IQU7_9ACTN|nr:IS110 family transposase [Nocardioides panzhihuensis]NYI76294.1 transposase [Nocardioides panzhihuensis]NYI79619.1 transposase [Nocardioides panzhihuensis]